MATFGENLKRIREERGLSQEGLASLIDRPRATLAKWETDKYYPTVAILPDLSEVLDVDINEFFK